ncbi:MAG: protein translocase subunit SecF [Candidatus Aminicenantales bacterium]
MQFFKTPNINFMKYKYVALALSGIIILGGLVNIIASKGLKLGVDFSGGTLIRVKFKNPISITELRAALKNVNLGASSIQEFEKREKEYQIRTQNVAAKTQEEQEMEAHEIMGNRVIEALRTEEEKQDLARGMIDLNSMDLTSLTFLLEPVILEEASQTAQRIISFRNSQGIIEDFSQLESLGVTGEVLTRLKERTLLGSPAILSRETVGPQVGKDLRRRATQACIWALIGMLIYIALRFKLSYGVSSIITLTHDLLFTIGIFSFTSRELNLAVIAALLTIVGFSINDTIVIFDRVRDNLKIMRKSRFEEILNASINQTLSRSIITSGTVFLTVLALFIFGGEVINDFAFTMLIGVIVGSYSTIYQSCPIVYFWQKIFKPKKGYKK